MFNSVYGRLRRPACPVPWPHRDSDAQPALQRLTAFVAACDAVDVRVAAPGPVRTQPLDAELRWGPLVQANAEGAVVTQVPAARIDRGQRVLITGPSGTGKSTLVRAIAGLALGGAGHIALPTDTSIMFVPQRTYLPDGSLLEALAYPRAPSEFATADMAAAVQRAGLTRYGHRLGETAQWASLLSPGEQQRVHFARVLLHRPGWVLFDESSSALDEAGERELYLTVREHCPATTVLSVGHRSSLKPLHDREWSLRDGDVRAPRLAALPAAATA